VKVNLVIVLLFISRVASAQSAEADKNTRAGNEFYKQQQFDKAAAEYGKAIAADPRNWSCKIQSCQQLI
jgi:tetratricopeptide (TPR) repeat protein